MKENTSLFSNKGENTLPRARARYLTQSITLEERGPAGIISGAIFLSLFFLFASLVWSSVTVVNETARAPGEVVPAHFSVNIQHMEGGLVKDLKVRDGDHVGKDELLLVLDDTLLRSELEQMRVRKASYSLQAERLSALLEKRKPDFGIEGEAYQHLAEKQRMIYRAQYNSHKREQQVAASRIKQKQREVSRQENLVKSLEKEAALLEEQVAMKRKLSTNQLLSRNDLLVTQSQLAEIQSDLAQARDSVLVAQSALEEARQRKLELEAGFFKDIELEAGRVSAELAEIEQTLLRLEDRVRRMKIRAPAAGIVQNLRINSDMAVINAGQIIMQIIPTDDELVVNAKVSPADIGHVQQGNRADIRIDSYDTVRFGMLEGKVRRISATTYLDDMNQPYYRAEIVLSKDHLGPDERPLRIIPGMTVTADIRTGEKTLLNYLLRPIRRGLDASFGER